MPLATTPQALTIPEAAAWLRVSRSTVYRLLGAGTLVAAKVGGRRLVLGWSLEALLRQEQRPA